MAARTNQATSGKVTLTAAVPLGEQLAAIRAKCQDLSVQHRLALPPDLVRDRMATLARDTGQVMHDRALEICFLLDQYGSLRYNELRRMLGPISTRTLADKLAFLHARGLVGRRLYDESPPRVEYRLTDHGKAFTDLVFPVMLHTQAGPP